ncbi:MULTISPECIES: glycosyltransferase family 1 protein [unclassified Pseudomonas]|uniref:glycosyltransferase family 4 protein n=1 Tax=unclassified Pseudomonas TaxID=196821 RepID=UPI0024489B32|nr:MULTISPECIES: glycosyltransferase family 1 protein [unclassified Pseudomonas]MDG9925176.1 glycosyltransferase family 4 protein [Pseudomonas sp. GD04045]MDH0035306.1 glycosyltransferase family 4 protein [Pseudomonas sp. GD04019]
MRLLIECTYVFEHPDLNSGIQRVVRNVIRELKHNDANCECIPVVMQNGQLRRVLTLLPQPGLKLSWQRRWAQYLDYLRVRYWGAYSALLTCIPVLGQGFLRLPFFTLCKVFNLAITLPLRACLWLDRRNAAALQRSEPIDIVDGDIFLLLDSSWHLDFYDLADRLKARGASIISVVYDLIPLTHPQFCDAGLTKVFERWFDWIARTADGFVCISRTVEQDVRHAVNARQGAEVADSRLYDHFYLGSELDLATRDTQLDPALQEVFSGSMPVYLMVSTIEPRKNHAYLLDAFERLWARGVEARLCIIGKVGWKSEELVGRIQHHPELNRRLFIFNRLNDSGLEYAYAHARALVFPSHAEGFGLPLVEAMQRGVPVMASDIPVFREIGDDYVAYFDLADPEALASLVEKHLHSGQFPVSKALAGWQWIDWREASLQLLDKTLRIAGRAEQVHESPANRRA